LVRNNVHTKVAVTHGRRRKEGGREEIKKYLWQ
jgi:hypothetical protein